LIFNKHVTNVHAVIQTDNIKCGEIPHSNTNIRTTRLKKTETTNLYYLP